ncbi:unnamed protein product, partial [Strongylus vulgaris]
KGDKDASNFVAELKKSGVGDNFLVISNTKSSSDIVDLYDLKDNNAVGEEQEISGRIIDFGHGTISTRSTRRPVRTTQKPSKTPAPTRKTTSKTVPPSRTTPKTPVPPGKSTTETPAPSSKTSPKTPVPPSVPTTPEKPGKKFNCLFVGDLYNYGDDTESYELEAELLSAVGYDFFDETVRSHIALWAYGYTDFPRKVNATLKDMSKNYEELKAQIEKMKYVHNSNAMSTESAIKAINEMYDTEKRLDCLVFLSAQSDTRNLPQIAPQHLKFKRVVVVGLSEPEDELRCLFIGDLYNYGTNKDAYDNEREFISTLGFDYFKEQPYKAGFWAYGYTKYPESPNLDKMFADYREFDEELKNMEYSQNSDPLSTLRVIKVINSLKVNVNQMNCLVLFAAPNNTQSLPVLDPHSNIKRIVAVGFNSADLTDVAGKRGVAVSVPYNYVEEDVKNVLDAIMGR